MFFWGERHDVPQLLKASDIFVLATIQREGLSISVLEALAYQIPVVATHVGGLPEVIDNHINGFLVTPSNPLSLAAAIEGLMINEEKRLGFAQAGLKKFQEQFESKIMIEHIERLYKECLKAYV